MTMENRTFSPIVLAVGLLAAALVGFVAARQVGDASPTPEVVAADVNVAGGDATTIPTPDAVADGTEVSLEPAAESSGATSTPAPASAGRGETVAEARPVTARPAPATASSSEVARPAARPAARTPARPSAPAPAPARAPAATTPEVVREAPAPPRPDDTARQTPTWSRPFPAPEAMESLPTRTAPRIDAPPPPPQIRTVTLAADSVVGLQLEQTVSTDSAKVEDAVQARVTRDVYADGVMVIPAGTRVTGSVTLVDEGGKVRERARLGVRFHTLVLADGTELRLPTETIYRDGESPSGRSAARIGGGAAAGAVIGAILGGGKGAAIGAAIGAGGGTAATMGGSRRAATLPSGQALTVRLSEPVSVDVPR